MLDNFHGDPDPVRGSEDPQKPIFHKASHVRPFFVISKKSLNSAPFPSFPHLLKFLKPFLFFFLFCFLLLCLHFPIKSTLPKVGLHHLEALFTAHIAFLAIFLVSGYRESPFTHYQPPFLSPLMISFANSRACIKDSG